MPKKITKIFVVVLFGIALFLRIKPAILRPIVFDEAYTVVFLTKFDRLIDLIKADPSVPPLHYLLIKFLMLFSSQMFFLRLPSLIFSGLSLIIIYQWLKKYSQKVALSTLLLLSFSSLLINYSWQAYVYAQLFFFGILSLYSFQHLFYFQKPEKAKLYLNIFFFSSLAAFFTHYGFIWTLAGMAIIIIFDLQKHHWQWQKLTIIKKQFLLIFTLMVLVLLAYLPIFAKIFTNALERITYSDPLLKDSLGEKIIHLSGLFDLFNLSIFRLSALKYFAIGLLSLLIIQAWQRRNDWIIFSIVILLSNLLLPIIASLIIGQSIYASRSIIVASFSLTFLITDFLMKSKYDWQKIASALMLCFFIGNMLLINPTTAVIYEPHEVAKKYRDWFRQQKPSIDQELIFFIYNNQKPFQTQNFQVDQINLDYYWHGYDGQTPLPDYHILYPDEWEKYILEKKKFYLLVMLNTSAEIISQEICPQANILFSADESLNLNIYQCN